MQVLTADASVPAELKGGVVAIGNFDGVHRGHQALIEKVRQRANGLGTASGVMVFEPHPREFFQPSEPHFRLTPLPLKLRRFAALGLDFVNVKAFDKDFASLSAAAFIEHELVAMLAPRHVVIGYDFFFGKGRSGTPETMRLAGQDLGFGVTVVAPVAEDGEVFSSTSVRLKLAQGDVRHAASDLGTYWRVSGRVVGGAQRGTGIGFPTANIALEPGTALAHGIYAVFVEVDGVRRRGAAYLGTRPTFDNGAPVLEVFLLDFDGDLYGKDIEVAFVDFIRADRRFDSVEALQAQMTADCDRARAILADAESTV
ncbi:MAG: bifunctional riboflavin kinase/FAD synthetase [Hyphomicrobiaceae bacterium]|nr:bifunctional riboflavin kinase/FAD synthetase [Hyphomicrobiaceae bacterium]